jgi:hypothetical protein
MIQRLADEDARGRNEAWTALERFGPSGLEGIQQAIKSRDRGTRTYRGAAR